MGYVSRRGVGKKKPPEKGGHSLRRDLVAKPDLDVAQVGSNCVGCPSQAAFAVNPMGAAKDETGAQWPGMVAVSANNGGEGK